MRVEHGFITIVADRFADWRDHARRLLSQEVLPASIHWQDAAQARGLFTDDEAWTAARRGDLPASSNAPNANQPTGERPLVPREFLSLAETVSCHRDPGRWEVLYRALWRITHDEPHLLSLATDDDVHALHHMEQAVRRDAHKAKAFVRFRRSMDETGEHFLAWHRPDHRILPLVAPFFEKRFAVMRWAIMTPDESIYWDGETLQFGPGVPRALAPPPDELEGMWKQYYAATFNPARIKLKMMKREMPVRHWSTLPETEMIGQMLEEAPARVQRMLELSEGISTTARDFFPQASAGRELTLQDYRDAARGCQGCPLHAHATQTVFGEGPAGAQGVLVGEQPGDEEDLVGQPFVGPAGRLLNDALLEAGLDREQVYVTNTVKHFKFEQAGPRRLHKKPGVREITSCRPWLERELQLIKPRVLVCLGSTAAQALLGRDFKITQRRGVPLESEWAPWTIATYHPSALLRMNDAAIRDRMRAEFIADLALAAAQLQHAAH